MRENLSKVLAKSYQTFMCQINAIKGTLIFFFKAMEITHTQLMLWIKMKLEWKLQMFYLGMSSVSNSSFLVIFLLYIGHTSAVVIKKGVKERSVPL